MEKNFVLVMVLAMGAACDSPSSRDTAADVAHSPSVASAVSASAAKAPLAPASAAQPTNPCPTLCERSRTLNCPSQDDCNGVCRGMQDTQACSGEMSAVFACMVGEPIQHWECSEDGLPALKDGHCDPQQSALFRCLEQTASRSGR
jgi:hypothetical protein